MSQNARRNFNRRTKTKPELKTFFVSTEGTKTEPAYLRSVWSLYKRKAFDEGKTGGNISLKLVSNGNCSAPRYRLEELQKCKADDGDESWVVCDRDKWNKNDLQTIEDWRLKSNERGFVLSVPCFEYWLLFHYNESPKNFDEPRKVVEELKNYFQNYSKSKLPEFTLEQIEAAIYRAKNKPNKIKDLIEGKCGSNVFMLIERFKRKIFELDD